MAFLLKQGVVLGRGLASSTARLTRHLCRPSYWHMPGDEPLTPMTVGRLLERAAERWGEREALVSSHQGHRLSFRELLGQVDKLAAGFVELGLHPGDRIGMWGPDSREWYLTYLAAARAGLILVTINPAYQPPELHYCLSKVSAKALVTADVFRNHNYPAMVGQVAPELGACPPGSLRSPSLPALRSVVVVGRAPRGTFSFSDVFEGASASSVARLRELQDEIQPDDGCNLQFTSGTTGKPKGTLLSHHSVVNNSYLIGKSLGFHLKHPRICLQVPLFHAYGNVIGVLSALHHGGTLVLASPRFQPEASLRSIRDEGCTVVYGTPTMHIDLLAKVEEEAASLPSLEVAVTAGAVCSSSLLRRLKERLRLQRVCSLYGMTETGPVSFASLHDDPDGKCWDTVGRVLGHTEVKVVDARGHMVPMGQAGELYVRGYLTMLGYWGDDARTGEVMGTDRWLRTGDQFVLHEDGYGQVVGRIKDMIIRGGENIFPKELEDFLEELPGVAEAQVFGVPDHRYGEEVCACIRMKEGSEVTCDVIKGYCKGQLAHFKIPRHIRFLREFPKTASGKIQKFKLQEMMAKELASDGGH